MLTLLTVVGLQFASVLGGSVVLETIFSIPGIGAWLVFGVSNRDYQVVQAIAVIFAIWFLLITLLTDIMYAWVDPRIRY
jgi:ABC-type dipeptide/oligopeptide/nickel transport system permease component